MIKKLIATSVFAAGILIVSASPAMAEEAPKSAAGGTVTIIVGNGRHDTVIVQFEDNFAAREEKLEKCLEKTTKNKNGKMKEETTAAELSECVEEATDGAI